MEAQREIPNEEEACDEYACYDGSTATMESCDDEEHEERMSGSEDEATYKDQRRMKKSSLTTPTIILTADEITYVATSQVLSIICITFLYISIKIECGLFISKNNNCVYQSSRFQRSDIACYRIRDIFDIPLLFLVAGLSHRRREEGDGPPRDHTRDVPPQHHRRQVPTRQPREFHPVRSRRFISTTMVIVL